MCRWALEQFSRLATYFSSDNPHLLPRIQYICWNFNPSCFLLTNMCVYHVSLRSVLIPEYLVVSPCGICFPLSVIVGQFSVFKVKVTWLDLCSLAFICQSFNHFSNRLR
jgi:hypothetical protein